MEAWMNNCLHFEDIMVTGETQLSCNLNFRDILMKNKTLFTDTSQWRVE